MDNKTITSTLKRYFKTGNALTGLATKFLSQEYLNLNINKKQHAHNLKEILGELKGPLMKAAQFLATIPDAIPHEYAQELMHLQSKAPPMGQSFVKRRMANELGVDWQSNFIEFDLNASAAASLGQVHKAITKAGEVVACKLQYPNMLSSVGIDLDNLKHILGVYSLWNKAIDTQDVQIEITERLIEELDYLNEANNIAIYNKIFKDNEFVKTPNVLPHLTTPKLLTMSWANGSSIYDFIDHDNGFKNNLSDNLFKAWYQPLYGFAVLHCDPHPGNYLIEAKGIINLLDFGCVRHFSELFLKGILLLYQGLLHNDREKAIYAYECLGFKGLDNEIIEIIDHWARLLYEPLLEDKIRPIQNNFSANKGIEVASKVHSELNRLGGIKPPREFVFMDRSAVALGGVFMRLRVERNWHKLFEEIINNKEL